MCWKEVGAGLTEKGTWKKPAQEHQGEMFGTSSEAVRSPVRQGRKETGETRTEQRQELTEEGPPTLLPGAPSAEQTVADNVREPCVRVPSAWGSPKGQR